MKDTLSKREIEVLTLLASGERITDIARTLFRSVKTISTHRARIREKFGLDGGVSTIKIVEAAKLAGYLQPEST